MDTTRLSVSAYANELAATRDAAAAEVSRPEPCGLCQLRAKRGIEPPPGGCTCQAPAVPPLPGSAYADESADIRDAAEDIGVYLALWAMRDDSKPCPDARRAANSAMDAIDRALAELHALRSRLVSDIRASDDAAAARVDELLATRATGSAR